jgi:integrase
MAKPNSFRVGKVRADLRGKVWYLTYHEDGQRIRCRVSSDRKTAQQMAAQVNAQIEVSAPTAFSFEAIGIDQLQERWLKHHEHVLRSSVHTIRRYRTATHHLINFVRSRAPRLKTAQFTQRHAENFVRYLRTIEVAPNGHANTAKRPLLDNGVRYILTTCRSMFVFAGKHRHLSPYSENPFSSIDLDRMPTEDARPIHLLSFEQERQFLEQCDDWQFPIFLLLMLTGMRPGEATHLLLPDDVDLQRRLLSIRNKPQLGWQVKTRNERVIPIVSELADVLEYYIGHRVAGPLITRRSIQSNLASSPVFPDVKAMESALMDRSEDLKNSTSELSPRELQQKAARLVWREAGAIRTDRIRCEFMRLTRAMGLPEMTAPKSLRHLFATELQDKSVDPLIRSELMGHSTNRDGGGLGMTGRYTHTRPETKARELERALSGRAAIPVAREWLTRRQKQ